MGQPEKYIGVHYLGVVGQAHDLTADGCGAHFYIYWDGTIYQRCSLDAVRGRWYGWLLQTEAPGSNQL